MWGRCLEASQSGALGPFLQLLATLFQGTLSLNALSLFLSPAMCLWSNYLLWDTRTRILQHVPLCTQTQARKTLTTKVTLVNIIYVVKCLAFCSGLDIRRQCGHEGRDSDRKGP